MTGHPRIDTLRPCVNGVQHDTPGPYPHHPDGWCRECGMTEQTNDPLADDDLWREAHAEAMRRHDAGELYALTKSRVTTFVEGALWGASVLRASGAGLGGPSAHDAWDEGFEEGMTFRVEQVGPSGVPIDPPLNPYPESAGLGGTTREQASMHHYTPGTEGECSAGIGGGETCGLPEAAHRPDPAPDDTTDLRVRMTPEEVWVLVEEWAEKSRRAADERDAARADLVALREGIERAHGQIKTAMAALDASDPDGWATYQRLHYGALTTLSALLGGIAPNQHREKRPVQKKWRVKYDPVQQLWHLTDPEGRWVNSWHRERWQIAINTAQLLAVIRYSRSGR